MRSSFRPLILIALAFIGAAAPAFAGLYDSDAKTVKSGDLNDRDYWQAKFDMMMLDLALKQKQPEGRIGLNLVSTVNNLKDLAKKYPAHTELKEMLAKAEDIQKKIDPNASRSDSWKPGCPWDEANFVQYWVNFHAAREALKAKEMDKAKMYLSNVKQNQEFLSRPDRLKDYPEELRKWYEESKPEVEKMDKEASGH